MEQNIIIRGENGIEHPMRVIRLLENTRTDYYLDFEAYAPDFPEGRYTFTLDLSEFETTTFKDCHIAFHRSSKNGYIYRVFYYLQP